MKLNLKLAFIAILGSSSLSFVATAVLSQVPPVGFEFKGESSGLNQAKATATKSVGDCARESEEPVHLKAYFLSSVTPPAAGRRVVISNITEGVNPSKAPYTDREYDKGRVSQGITMTPGYDHHGSALVFIPNQVNEFGFEILENKQVVERGSFQAVINVNTETVERNANWKTELFCIDTGTTNMLGCRSPGTREKGVCPSDYYTTLIPRILYRNIRSLNDQNLNDQNQNENTQ